MNLNLSPQVIRYGDDKPLPVKTILRAGKLSAVLEEGILRNIRFGEHEVVRGIYAAVRDQNWRTIPGDIQALEIEQNKDFFKVCFTSRHDQNEIQFDWNGTIEGTSDGFVRYTMNGVVKSDFLKNRIGFCVLHPMDLAGTDVEIKTPNGIQNGQFPLDISPHQPFFDITAIHHSVGEEMDVKIAFEGDLFEMEDQRNWTDASYKTYCTPLGKPFPVEVKSGEFITQSVTVQVRETKKKSEDSDSRTKDVRVKVKNNPLRQMPKLGTVLADNQVHSNASIELLKELKLDHLRCSVDFDSDGWQEKLYHANKISTKLHTTFHLEVNWHGPDAFKELIRLIQTNNLPVSHLFIFSKSTFITLETDLLQAKEILAKKGGKIPVGGGSNAYFTQFNREILPIDVMDFAGYPLNPQVHAFDHTSLIETLEAQLITVHSARKIIRDLPLIVGPITFKIRINPDAIDPSASLLDAQSRFDPRQQSLFGAGWTIGSLANLASTSVEALTFYETLGLNGLLRNEGYLYPLYHVFADIAEMGDANILSVENSTPNAVAALAIVSGSQIRVLLANVTNDVQEVHVELPAYKEASIRKLDETNAVQAMFDGNRFRHSTDMIRGFENPISLRPCGIVRIDLNIE